MIYGILLITGLFKVSQLKVLTNLLNPKSTYSYMKNEMNEK